MRVLSILLLLTAAANAQESDAPSDVPSGAPLGVDGASAVPTMPSDTGAGTCTQAEGTGRCPSLMGVEGVPAQCDCYNFCGTSFKSCSAFGSNERIDCGPGGEVTSGCTDADRGGGAEGPTSAAVAIAMTGAGLAMTAAVFA